MQFQHSEEGYGLSHRIWDYQPATTITTRSFVVCNRRLAKPVIHVWRDPLLIDVNEGSTHRYIS
ncbi:hypothetical protein CY34DRAFT_801975 [Suillus luteus UH-Slu-Lm8-n1]|uniref:Uncharacterized protein n=1 Tax=Suillus luteus UH-Slu-Lm8-n1 TaxID=930992 RepID=A0A0D0ATW0_9AGAM|nr:hypothetical protein CY34DRAFT_801975 [Suillus luteus UH-Slu-Lm8-n1]